MPSSSVRLMSRKILFMNRILSNIFQECVEQYRSCANAIFGCMFSAGNSPRSSSIPSTFVLILVLFSCFVPPTVNIWMFTCDSHEIFWPYSIHSRCWRKDIESLEHWLRIFFSPVTVTAHLLNIILMLYTYSINGLSSNHDTCRNYENSSYNFIIYFFLFIFKILIISVLKIYIVIWALVLIWKIFVYTSIYVRWKKLFKFCST